MATRKPHKKSRTGCQTCKRRHVKCGEEHPICANCIEYDIQCAYAVAAPPSPHPTNPLMNNGPSPTGSTASSLTNLQDGAGKDPIPASSSDQELNVSDLELLHHFSTATYTTMSNVASEQVLWQKTIVSIGLSHTFLLRGLMALSAIHLSYLNPSRSVQYLIKAAAHQDVAISQFRVGLSTISPETFDAVLAYSCLLPIQALAISASSQFQTHILSQEPDRFTDFLKSLQLLRSVNKLLLPQLKDNTSSAILPLMQVATEDLPTMSDYPGRESLDILEARCTTYAELTTMSSNRIRGEIYRETISQLKLTFSQAMHIAAKEKFTIGITLIWALSISDEYYTLMAERDHCAIAILAHFAALLQAQEDIWWLEGLGRSLIHTINGELGLEWEEIMRWPNMVASLTNA